MAYVRRYTNRQPMFCHAGKNKHAWTINRVLEFPHETGKKSMKFELFFSDFLATFLNCPILYENGEIKVFVISLFSNFLSEICNAYTFTCFNTEEGLAKILETKKTFLIYPRASNFLLFTKDDGKNHTLFQELNPERFAERKEMTKVKFEDVIQTSRMSEQRKRKHIYVTKRYVSLRGVKANKRLLKAMPPKISQRELPVNAVYPLFSGNQSSDQYPTQVSDEQNLPECTVFAFGRNSQQHNVNESTFASSSPPLSRTEVDSTLSITEHSLTRSPPRYQDYFSYNARMYSFRNWESGYQNAHDLSQAGFFFTGNADLVRCFQCGIGLKDFYSDVVPVTEHVRYSPECPFMRESLGEARLSEIRRSFNSSDPNFYRQWNGRGNNANQRRYRHPEYAEFQQRMKTFARWPSRMTQTPTQLAEAGLYYTGFEDQVRCFACDGGLRRWDVGDDPWTEHCRWFPNCPYAIEVKGEEFIALIQATVDAMTEGDDIGDEVQSGLEQMTLSDPVTQVMLSEHQTSCLEMGYEEVDFKSTVQELRNRGNAKPSLDDILDLIDIIKVNRQQQTPISSNETLEEKNRRLKSYVFCMKCQKNDINALFLPCGHHKLCMSCAEPLQACPVCARDIREKIKTYMG